MILFCQWGEILTSFVIRWWTICFGCLKATLLRINTCHICQIRRERGSRQRIQAATEVLGAARVVFHGSVAGSSVRPEQAHLLDLSSELLHEVLSFVYPGALSDRQIGSVVQHAADRRTLLPGPLERQVERRTCAQSCFDLEAHGRLLSAGRIRFLKETGCDRYDR